MGKAKLTRGLGSLSQHLIQQWLQALGIRITCVCKLCTSPALKDDTSIQTLHNAQLPTPFLSFFPFTLRGGLTQRGGSYDGFFLAWTFGDIKWQSARAARVPISGPSHPTVVPAFATVVPSSPRAPARHILRDGCPVPTMAMWAHPPSLW